MTVPVHGDGRALDARLRSAGPGSSPGARMDVSRETMNVSRETWKQLHRVARWGRRNWPPGLFERVVLWDRPAKDWL